MSSESLLSTHDEEEEEKASSSAGFLRNTMEARAEHQKTKMYQSLYAFTTSMGVGLVILELFWILHYKGGFAWSSNPAQQFFWHPLLMTLGMVVLYSQSILVYRTGRSSPKRRLKIFHALIHFLAFILSVIGLKAVFDSHNLAKNPIPNLYSLHSWIGLIAVILFSFQFVGGFLSFLYPGISKTYRQALMPVHTAVGTGTFVLAIVTVVSGLTEKVLWTLQDKYSQYASEGIVFNLIGVFTVFYGVMVLYLVGETTYKRIPVAEDEIALNGSN